MRQEVSTTDCPRVEGSSPVFCCIFSTLIESGRSDRMIYWRKTSNAWINVVSIKSELSSLSTATTSSSQSYRPFILSNLMILFLSTSTSGCEARSMSSVSGSKFSEDTTRQVLWLARRLVLTNQSTCLMTFSRMTGKIAAEFKLIWG